MKLRILTAAVCGAVASFAVHAETIVGQIVDSAGNPVAGANVDFRIGKKQTTTDANGRFSIDTSLNKGELHIMASGFAHQNVDWEQQAVKVVLTKSVMEQIDVIGSPMHSSNLESAQPVNVLAGEALRDKQAATLGETLKHELGVHSSYFGPVSSTPIIRGLDGPRVLVTQNGLDASDASRVGPDHVVATEALNAQQVEVFRGPATLVYGSGAIGGVVNVVDNRVPTSSDYSSAAQLSYGSVSDEMAAAFDVTTGTDKYAFHFDAFMRDADNYEIPGLAVYETEEEHEEEGHEEHESTGKLESSAFDATGFNVGASYLLDNGYVGFSYGRLDKTYGIPGHSHGAEEHAEEEGHDEHEAGEHDAHEAEAGVEGDLKQDRWQLISELSLDNDWISAINTHIGYTDYRHAEIENGVVGTQFFNQTTQFKTDLMMHEIAGWRGTFAFEYKDVDFEALGEEAFTPASDTTSFSVAYMQEKHIDDWLVQWGVRAERVSVSASNFEANLGHHDEDEHDEHEADHDEHADEEHHEDEHTLIEFADQNFTPINLSLGAVWDFAEGYNLGISYTHAQRAPSASELFSFGPHIGTNTFEVGSVFHFHEMGEESHFDLEQSAPKVEKSNNLDLSLRKFEGDTGFIFNLFYNQVTDYYYQRNTGHFRAAGHDHEEHEVHGEHETHEEQGHDDHAAEGGLPVYVYEQQDVTLYGYEAEFVWQTTEQLKTRLVSDYIRAELDNGGNLPRIPPMRLGAVFNYEQGAWQAQLSAMHYFKQNKVATLETETSAYTMLDANVSYQFFVDSNEFVSYLKLNNITDEEARVHSSFLKNQTLLPGRGIELGIRGYF